MKIGVLAYRMNFYTNLRLIVGKLPEAEYVPVHDIFSIRRTLASKVNQVIGKPLIPIFNLNNQFEDFDLNKVDVLHFSNGISYGRTPWVSSFETILPRVSQLMTRHQGLVKKDLTQDNLIKRGLDAICGSACLQIVPWSQCTANIQRDLLTEFSPEYGQLITSKMKVLPPPQKLILEKKEAREYSDTHPIRFVLTGAGFFRKGGREILLAFEKLVKQEGLPIQLVLISSLKKDDYASHETDEDIRWAKQKINDNPNWIEYHASLPNETVLEVMKGCDVGLLPSYAETYGLSILEAQACGCPVISTDIRAFPEMNNETTGWLIRVPKNNLKEAFYTTPEERNELSKTIQSGLEVTIKKILADPQIIAVKGKAAIEKIKRDHDPDTYANRLREIYQLG